MSSLLDVAALGLVAWYMGAMAVATKRGWHAGPAYMASMMARYEARQRLSILIKARRDLHAYYVRTGGLDEARRANLEAFDLTCRATFQELYA